MVEDDIFWRPSQFKTNHWPEVRNGSASSIFELTYTTEELWERLEHLNHEVGGFHHERGKSRGHVGLPIPRICEKVSLEARQVL